MSLFKEQLARDIKDVFFNVDEFSGEVIIDGKCCVVQIDSDRLNERAGTEYGGITTGLILYFIAASYFPKEPEVGNSQIFNNKLHYIDSVTEVDGVYEIIINQNRGG